MGLIDGGTENLDPTTTTTRPAVITTTTSSTTTTTIVLPEDHILRTAEDLQDLRDEVQRNLESVSVNLVASFFMAFQ